MAKLTEFIEYLNSQIGQPYVWGGQHTRLRKSDYVNIIERKETSASHEKNAIAFCKAKFDDGESVLYGSDCSGLGMYWLYNKTKTYGYDMSANSMMSKCDIVTGTPKRGYWVFRVSNGKATHIGYMVNDTEVIHAKGRAYGVIKEKYRTALWDRIGIPKIFADEINEPVSGAYEFSRVLKYGSKGNDVIELKKLLTAKGYKTGITVNTASSKNFYGSTRNLVKAFQKAQNLTVDGKAGKNTITALGGIWRE